MEKFNLSFCDDYSYPHKVKDIIATFCEICCHHLGDNLLAIMLIGSGARGELTCTPGQNDELVLYSDLEFFVCVKHSISNALKKRIVDSVVQLQHPYAQTSHFFHIDFSLAPISLFKKESNRFIIFESKATGKIVFGSDIKPFFPDISGTNLNFRELNEVLLHRLWSMLLYLPESFLHDKNDDVNLSYILCRNVLDITTWLLPYENKILIPGFKKRLNFINTNWDRLSLKDFFSQDDLRFLNQCLEGKMNLKFFEPTMAIYKKSIRLFVISITYMLHKNNIKTNGRLFQESLLEHSGKLFEGRSLKRKIIEAYMFKNKAWKCPLRDSFQWICCDKRAHAVLFNLNMHLANISYMEDSDKCFSILETAETLLKKMFLDYKNTETGYLKKWGQLRTAYINYLTLHERGFQTKKEYFLSVTGVK